MESAIFHSHSEWGTNGPIHGWEPVFHSEWPLLTDQNGPHSWMEQRYPFGMAIRNGLKMVPLMDGEHTIKYNYHSIL